METRKIVKEYKNTNKKKKIFLYTVIVLVSILILIIGFIVWFINDKLSKVQRVEIDLEDIGVTQEAEENLVEYRNIALFGIDSREDEYSRGNRSDCIIILSINNKTNEAKIFSIYRDTYLQIEGYGLDKVTHAYSYGEAPLALKTLNTNLDLNIKEFVAVNFNSLATTINKLGGVTMNIENDELKYINGYIDATSKNTGISSSHVTQAGLQKLDGVQAVAYSRIRYTEGGDYKRAERMRTVLVATIQEMKKKNIFELNDIADEILPKVYTNISSSEILSIIPKIASYNINDNIGWPYETRGITLDRWYGVPVTLENNVLKLHKEFFKQEDYVVPENIKEISNQIINRTGYSE